MISKLAVSGPMGIGPRPPTSSAGMSVLGQVVDQEGAEGAPQLCAWNWEGMRADWKTDEVMVEPDTPLPEAE